MKSILGVKSSQGSPNSCHVSCFATFPRGELGFTPWGDASAHPVFRPSRQQRRSFRRTSPTGGHLTARGWPSWSSTTAWCLTWLCPASPAWLTREESLTRTPRYCSSCDRKRRHLLPNCHPQATWGALCLLLAALDTMELRRATEFEFKPADCN